MADINLHKLPNTIEQAYGPVVVTLNDNDESPSIRLLCRIQDADENIVGFFRQPPNQAGYSHFDVSKVLQTKVSSNPDLESTELLQTATDELFEYRIGFGFEQNGTNIIVGFFTTPYYAFNGRKEYYTLDWDKSEYSAKLGSDVVGQATILISNNKYKALTDRHYNNVTYASITDGKPATNVWNTIEGITKIDIKPNDSYTLTFLNDYYQSDVVGVDPIQSWTNGLNGFYIQAFNGNTEVLPLTILFNTQGVGGGPAINQTDTTQPTGEYKAITMQTGDILTYLTGIDYTHYYVAGWAWSRNPATNTNKAVITRTYRFDLVDDCSDYPNIQVSWTNSFGFRDYFDFSKKNEYKTDVQRNTYTKTNVSWNTPDYTITPSLRGEAVYGQSYDKTYLASTRFLSDAESAYLENLYLSPDVRVRFEGSDEWFPVVLTSNTFNQKTFRNNKLFEHTIEFKLSNKNPLQSK